MKSLFLFLGVVILTTQAQLLPAQCTIRTITTKWDLPNTNNLWNWTTQFYNDAYIKNRSGTTVSSPFYNPYSTFQNPNLIFLQQPTIKDCAPEDGWELLVRDFGTNVALPATAVSNPFFALYNRYTGTIRAFFMVTDPLSGTNNGATISLMFEGGAGRKESALMAHANPILNSLENFEKGIITRTANKYSNEYDFWLFAEFPTSYDPCTCNHSTLLTFTVQLIQTTNAALKIELTGTSTGTIKEVIKPAPDGVQTNLYSNSALNWVNGIVRSGSEGYKAWSSFKDFGNGIKNFLMATNPSQKTKLDGELTDLTNFFSAIPYLGGVLGVFDFLTGGGKRSAQSAGPMAFQANTQYNLSGSATGTLDLSTTRGYRTISTPGSNTTGSTYGIPAYDNILGIFTLLETPKIEYIDYHDNGGSPNLNVCWPNPNYDPNCVPPPDDPYYQCDGPSFCSGVMGDYDLWFRQYKLTSSIKYAINPASKMNLIDIKAALVMDYTNDNIGNWIEPAVFGQVPVSLDINDRYNKIGYEFETDKKTRTAFVPLSCVNNTSIGALCRAAYGVPVKFPQAVYIKIYATFRRQDATATTQDVIYVGTYKANIARSQLDPGNLQYGQIRTNYIDAAGYDIAPYGYGNTYYITTSQPIFPAPIPGIAGVTNPTYPAGCSSLIPPATDAEIVSFCSSKYNPIASMRQAYNDAFRPEISNRENTPQSQLSVYPNPFQDVTYITFKLSKPSRVSVKVTDQNGRVVYTYPLTSYTSGLHKLKLDRNNLLQGTYYCSLNVDGYIETSKIIIIDK